MNTRQLVLPSGPTVLGSRRLYRLSKNDLLINFTVDIAYLVPAELDVARLRNALAHTLTSFPLFCGKLVKEPEWAICLAPMPGAPLTIREGLPEGCDKSGDMEVVQLQPGPLIDRIDPFRLLSGEDPALAKVTVATGTNATFLGVSCTHTLADLHIVLKFLRTWSQLYIGMVIEPPPVYNDNIQLTLPSDPQRCAYLKSKLPSLLTTTFPLDNFDHSLFFPYPVTRIDVHFTGAQVSALHEAVVRLAVGRNGSLTAIKAAMLTRQDALSAFFVTVANASYDTPVTRIHNVVNCRGFNPDVLPKDMVGNGLQYAATPPVVISPNIREMVLTYAVNIRVSLLEARNPQYVKDVLAVSGEEWYQPAQANRGHYVPPTPGEVIINSNYRHDWPSAHFGHPGTVRWQHPDAVPTDNYILMFPSNPVQTHNGEWYTDEGACEVTLKVKKGREDLFMAALKTVWIEVVGEELKTPRMDVYA
ncbi:hypothetical protein ONZ51_g1367 [Trametes cubensis]|uniref:Uncharacterized protein n=1 Tax=Trametes cubensis TaxID=1111947 RepID=A0AAD7XD34_9APHY|nr:hypothetical protein ONZ51_g1367 [Trametes cubensis]